MRAHAAATGAVSARRLSLAAAALVTAAVLAIGVWRLVVGTGTATELAVYGSVPAFSLVERSGQTISSRDLAGRVWVADFIFTRCPGICPTLTTTLAALLRRLEERGMRHVTAVSISVDPANDDPATLRRYADRFGADPARWLFLTGEEAAVTSLVRDGFKLGVASLPAGERERAPEPITHSDRFVLVDAQLRIRGYYHGTDADAVATLEKDLARLSKSDR